MEVTINGISCVGTAEECKQFMNNIMNSTQLNKTNQSEEYVDLGLPSGKKWAKCNIGATRETESGLYFMWGDIVGRTVEEIKEKPCNYNTVPFGRSNCFNKIRNMVCPNGVLAKEYDAAYIHTHGKAHMPTREDFEELIDKTKVTYETINGVKGRKFTAFNGNSIFIPTAGYANNGSLYNQGSGGRVWSSSLGTFSPRDAWGFGFNSYSQGMYSDDRYCGFSVRGVIE